MIANGATLRDIHEFMTTVRVENPRKADISPELLRSLATRWAPTFVFLEMRLRELFDGLLLPHGDDYVLSMVGHLGGLRSTEARLFLLRHDAELRDQHFWRIFEVEGGGEVSLTNVDKYSPVELSWHNTVVQLVDEGTIDRARVLRSSLEALNRDFSAYRAGWFSKLYNSLSPSASEAAADQDLLRLCIGSHVTATVSLAIRHLEAVYNDGLLDSAEFVSACSPALSGAKGAAIAVIRVLAGLSGAVAAPTAAIAEVATYGLAHPHVDVQRAAVKLLVTLGRGDMVSASRDALSPVVAAQLTPQATHRQDDPGVDTLHAQDWTVTPAQPVEPWNDDDARERFAALLEFGSSALELELGLAWLASTTNAGAILAPSAKRAQKVGPGDDRFWIASILLVAVDPTQKYLPPRTWQHTKSVMVRGEQVWRAVGKPIPLPIEEDKTVLPSLVTRLREVASILQGQVPRRRLLATPTDTKGWINPDVVIDRFDNTVPPLIADLTQALLRVPAAERGRIANALGAPVPALTDSFVVEWRSQESAERRSNGSPKWVSWKPAIIAESSTNPSVINPALIPSTSAEGLWSISRRTTSSLVAAAFGIVSPASPLPLAATAIPNMHFATSEVNHAAGPILLALAEHPGAWTVQVAQVVALGMAALDPALRTQAVELLASAIPARISADHAAIGFAACTPVVAMNRWTSSFSDAATIAPHAVITLLTNLLPTISRGARGIGGLLEVLVNECLRQHQPVTDPKLREWLGEFVGTSTSARAAKVLLALT